jgi:S1-C subfamily serine protease
MVRPPALALPLLLLSTLLGGACADAGSEPEQRKATGETSPATDPFKRHAGSALDPRVEPGAGLLALAAGGDPALREHLAAHPNPDLLFPLSALHVKLVYLREDRVTTFVRDALSRPSRASTRQPIPDPFLSFLPAVAQAAVRGSRGPGHAFADLAVSTCFVVRPDGWLLTAHHAVDGARTIRVQLADGRNLPASVERIDADRDLGVLRIDARGLDYLPLGEPTDVRYGTRVFTVGFPAVALLGREPKFAEGVVSALGSRHVMQLSLPILPGNSGGPVVSEQGEVLGVLTQTATPQRFLAATGVLPQAVSFATRVEFGSALFEAPPALARTRTREEAIERAMASVCLVDASL